MTYNLRETAEGGILEADRRLPLTVRRQKTETDDEIRIVLTLTADDLLYYNVEQSFHTGLVHENCLLHARILVPQEPAVARIGPPSFHTGDSWQVREDRLSTPLTGIYDERSGTYYTVLRTDTRPTARRSPATTTAR